MTTFKFHDENGKENGYSITVPIGSFINRANYVRHMMHVPCAPGGPEVFIQTGFKAAAASLFSLNQLGCVDMLKNRAGISWLCGKHFKAMAKFGGEGGNKPRGKLPDAIDPGGSHFWYKLGPSIVEQGLWYMLLADIASNFVVNWTSLIYEMQDCGDQTKWMFSSTFNPHAWAAPQIFSPQFNFTGANACCSVGGSKIIVNAGCIASIAYHLDYGHLSTAPDAEFTAEARLVETVNGRVLSAGGTADGKNGNNSSVGIGRAQGSRSGGFSTMYHVEVRTTGIGQVTGGTIHVRAGGHSILPDFTDCFKKNVWAGTELEPFSRWESGF